MPMTLTGLQEIGLGDWPAWFRALNPGFFVNLNGNIGMGSNGNRGMNGRMNGGAGYGGYGVGGIVGGQPGQGLQYQVPMGEVPKRIGKGKKVGLTGGNGFDMVKGHTNGVNCYDNGMVNGHTNNLHNGQPLVNGHTTINSQHSNPQLNGHSRSHSDLPLPTSTKSSKSPTPSHTHSHSQHQSSEAHKTGKQIMERLKDMHTQKGREAVQQEREQKMEKMNILLEKGIRRETRRWEDDSEDEEVDGLGKVEEKEMILVDV